MIHPIGKRILLKHYFSDSPLSSPEANYNLRNISNIEAISLCHIMLWDIVLSWNRV